MWQNLDFEAQQKLFIYDIIEERPKQRAKKYPAAKNVVKGCRQKKTVYLQTLSKLRLTPLPPILFLTNLFLTKC